MLDYEEYTLLTFLQNNPSVSYSNIARKFNYTPATAKRKVNNLRMKGAYNGKYAIYSPSTLGLTKYIVVSFVDNCSKLEILKMALREQPYTTHRSFIYSPHLGVYCELNFPSEDSSLIIQFFDRLKFNGVITDFVIYKSSHIESSFPLDLSKISLDNFIWHFDWKSFKNSFYETNAIDFPVPKESVFSQTKEIDFKILRILSHNADLSQREISRKLKVDRTEIWRRIHFLEENVISGYKSKINRKILNVTSNKIFFLYFNDEEDLRKLFTLFSDKNKRPPFRYRQEVILDERDNNVLFLYISLPQHHEAQLFYFLHEIADVKSYDIDSAGEAGIRYSFYDPNYDPEKKGWRTNYNYVVDSPIEKLPI